MNREEARDILKTWAEFPVRFGNQHFAIKERSGKT